MMKTRVAIAVLLAGTLACGGSPPSSPSPNTSLNLSGTWTGTFQFATSGVTITDNVSATLAQTGQDVTGTWRADSGVSGQLTRLTPQASTTGTMTISQTTLTGTVCSATANVSGSASASTIDLTVAQIPPAGVCQWANSMQLALRRQ